MQRTFTGEVEILKDGGVKMYVAGDPPFDKVISPRGLVRGEC